MLLSTGMGGWAGLVTMLLVSFGGWGWVAVLSGAAGAAVVAVGLWIEMRKDFYFWSEMGLLVAGRCWLSTAGVLLVCWWLEAEWTWTLAAVWWSGIAGWKLWRDLSRKHETEEFGDAGISGLRGMRGDASG